VGGIAEMVGEDVSVVGSYGRITEEVARRETARHPAWVL
jgi:hypothetical protein